jgi:hypothetical protein
VKNTAASVWKTGNGSIETYKRTKAQFVLPELYSNRIIEHTFHLLPTPTGYDMIIGTDLMTDLGIKLNFQDTSVEWEEASMPFKDKDAKIETDLYIEDSRAVRESTSRMKQILDATYEKVELHHIVSECTHLSKTERRQLHEVLQEYETLFDGTLGYWKNEQYNIELQPDAKPYHARAYPIPKIHEQTLRTEVDRLCRIGVLRKVNRSEWAAPTFIIPKKNGTVRFISDFRELNKRIIRKPYPIPKIQDLLLKLKGFKYATSLDLNMGYYHTELTPYSQQLCTIVLPMGKYEY